MTVKTLLRPLAALTIAACLCLAAIPAQAAPAPMVDDFLDVPWGFTADQIDYIMREKGFSPDETVSTENIRAYTGVFCDYDASLRFHLLNGAFFMGEAQLGADAKGTSRQKIENMLAAKYGLPKLGGTKSEPALIWDGLKAGLLRDNIEISISAHFINKKPRIVYRNKSLETRLQTGTAPKIDGFIAENNDFKYYASAYDPAGVAGLWIRMIPGETARAQIATQRMQAGLPPEQFAKLEYILCRISAPDGQNRQQAAISEQIFIDTSGEKIADWQGPDWSATEPPAGYIAAECGDFIAKYFTAAAHTKVRE